MENPHFFYQQGSWCYQLAWQCFDLTVAQKLNVMGNELIAKARELQSAEHKPSPAQRDALGIDPHHLEEFEVPLTTSLKGLHDVIQAVMPSRSRMGSCARDF